MKDGQGGTGRKHPPSQKVEKSRNPHDGPKRGAPKKDWGAVERDPATARPLTKGKASPGLPRSAGR